MTEPKDKTAKKDDRSTAKWVAAGAAMGIGSAALVATLLYANRERSEPSPAPKKPVGPPPESD